MVATDPCPPFGPGARDLSLWDKSGETAGRKCRGESRLHQRKLFAAIAARSDKSISRSYRAHDVAPICFGNSHDKIERVDVRTVIQVCAWKGRKIWIKVLERIAGFEDPVDNWSRVGLFVFEQCLQIFRAGQVFVTVTRSILARNYKSHDFWRELLNVFYSRIGDNKTGGKHCFCLETSHDALCPCAGALHNDLAV